MWRTGSAASPHVGSSWTRARTHVPCIGRRTPNHCATREAPVVAIYLFIYFYTAGSYSLSILYILVYVCQYQSPNSSHHHHHPTPAFPPWCPYICSLHLCLFLPCKPVHLYHFSRFHIYVLIYDICFSLFDLLHSV